MATALGVEVVSEIRLADAKRAGKSSILVSGVDGNATKAVHITWTNGSDSVPGQLRRNAFVNDRFADDHSLKVGSPLIVTTLAGKTLRLHVHGIFDHPKGGSPFEDVAISKETFDRGFANHDNEFTLLNVRGGPSA